MKKSYQGFCAQKKFTLLELLIILVILAILMSLLLPSLSNAKNKAKRIVCLSNMKQAGTAMALYISSNSMQEPMLFRDFTGDHPFEGYSRGKGKMSPGNPAIWTADYLSDFKDIYDCPLVETDLTSTMFPSKSYNKMWGEYIYIYGKSTKTSGIWINTRRRYGQHTSIRRVNDESEDVVMTDYPKSLARRYYKTKWRIQSEHYNALMRDNSAKTISLEEGDFILWMFDSHKWGG